MRQQTDKCSPSEAWSRSEYSHACFAQCQEFNPCPDFYRPSPFTFTFSKSSPYFLTALDLANAVFRVGLRYKMDTLLIATVDLSGFLWCRVPREYK